MYNPLWDLLNHLVKSSPPANAIPPLVPDDGSSALDPLLRVALIHTQKTVQLCWIAFQAVLKNLLSARAGTREAAG